MPPRKPPSDVRTRSLRERCICLAHARPHAADPAPSGSFIAEGSSFSRAPLNSRLPPVSPHRVTIAANTSLTARRASKRPANVQDDDLGEDDDEDRDLTYADEDYSDQEVDEVEQSFREVEERKREGLDKEPLEGLGPDLQEALIVEDLLFVLMVSWARSFGGRGLQADLDARRASRASTSNTTRHIHPRTNLSGCKEHGL